MLKPTAEPRGDSMAAPPPAVQPGAKLAQRTLNVDEMGDSAGGRPGGLVNRVRVIDFAPLTSLYK
jgi:hypothetical protein